MRSNQWELEEAQKALLSGEHKLCGRYLEKALECIRCYICHGALTDDYRPHFKGYVHLGCADQYAGRGDYERRHDADGRAPSEPVKESS